MHKNLPEVLYIKTVDENKRVMQYSNFDAYENSIIKTKDEVEVAYDGGVYLKGYAPIEPVLTIHEQAMQMSMPKETFVTMVEEITTAFSFVDPTSEPITFAKMWEWCSSDPNLLKLFITKTQVHRSDPVFNETASTFAPQFLQFLDMMFVYQNEIMAEIKLSKEQGRPLDLTAFIT